MVNRYPLIERSDGIDQLGDGRAAALQREMGTDHVFLLDFAYPCFPAWSRSHAQTRPDRRRRLSDARYPARDKG